MHYTIVNNSGMVKVIKLFKGCEKLCVRDVPGYGILSMLTQNSIAIILLNVKEISFKDICL